MQLGFILSAQIVASEIKNWERQHSIEKSTQNFYIPVRDIGHLIDSHLNNHGNKILSIFSTLSDTLHNKS